MIFNDNMKSLEMNYRLLSKIAHVIKDIDGLLSAILKFKMEEEALKVKGKFVKH